MLQKRSKLLRYGIARTLRASRPVPRRRRIDSFTSPLEEMEIYTRLVLVSEYSRALFFYVSEHLFYILIVLHFYGMSGKQAVRSPNEMMI